MTRNDQKRIVEGMLEGMRKSMDESLKTIPQSWDGFELRQLLADTAQAFVGKMAPKRMKEYRNECLTRNLPR